MNLKFEVTSSSETYQRWESGPYTIAWYLFKGDGSKHEIKPHFQVYYQSMHLDRDHITYDTLNEAKAACEQHREQQ